MTTSSRWFTFTTTTTTSTRSPRNLKRGNKLVPMSLEIIESSASLSPVSLSKKNNLRRSPETMKSVAPCIFDTDNFMNEPIELATENEAEEEKGIDVKIPTIFWEEPSPIGAGTALSTAQLNAECDLKYSDYQWMYDPQEGTLLPLGNHCLRVDLCYFRDGDIHFLSKSVQITVIPNKFTPPPPLVSVLPSLSLSPSSRSHNGNQPVQTSPSSIGNIARRIFNWSPKNKTSPTAAENCVSVSGSGSGSGSGRGSSGGLTLKWNDPESIVVGKVLTKQQLNATVTPFISGQYIYRPDLGTRLTVGRHQLSVEFRPEQRHREFFTPAKKITKVVYIEVLGKKPSDDVGAIDLVILPDEEENENGEGGVVVVDHSKPNPHEIPVKQSVLNYCRKDFSRHLKINSSYTTVTPAKKCVTPKRDSLS